MLHNQTGDFAALDLHYLPDATVQGTVVILDGSGFLEEEIPELLQHIDEILLPEVRLDHKNLTFTVVAGRILGSFTSEGSQPSDQPDSAAAVAATHQQS